MIIKLMTLKKEEFEIQIEEDNINIEKLKCLISDKFGADKYPLDKVKLVYSGNIMANSSNLSDYNYISPNPIICMAPLKKQTTKEPPPPAEPVVQPPPEPVVQPPSEPVVQLPSEPTDGIGILMGMGFNRNDAEAALSASFMNVERAVEYLISGNIPSVNSEQDEPHITSPADELERISQSLQSSPHFAEIIEALRNNPSLISTLADTLQNFNPEISEYVRQNPQRVLDSLGISSSDREENSPLAAQPSESSFNFSDVMPRTYRVAPDEMAMAQELVSLGFTLEQCVEALRLCDGNLDQAANYLFSQLDSDDS